MYYYEMNCRSEGAAVIISYLICSTDIFFSNETSCIYNYMFTR